LYISHIHIDCLKFGFGFQSDYVNFLFTCGIQEVKINHSQLKCSPGLFYLLLIRLDKFAYLLVPLQKWHKARLVQQIVCNWYNSGYVFFGWF